ncbi:MAG: SAM domain-containing protein [Rhodopila sp.]
MSIARPEGTLVDVGGWLRYLGRGQYETTFHENAVDAEVLPALTADDLGDLGITLVGHRRRLLEAIAALRAGPAPAADPGIGGSQSAGHR